MFSLQTIIVLLILVGPFILRVIAKYTEWQKQSSQRRRQRDELDGQIRFEDDQVSTRVQEPEAGNMTMAQRIELARERAQQQADPRRAQIEAERRAQIEVQRRAQAEALRRQQEQADAQRRQQAAARDQARRRQAAEEARRRGQAPPRQQPQAARPARSAQQQQVPVARPVSRRQQRASGERRRVQAVAMPASLAGSGLKVTAPMKRLSRKPGGVNLAGVLDGVSLKQAFILKELLDRPIALREDTTEYPA